MKTAISIPEAVFRSAENLASRLGVSRSELYAKAVAALVEKHREDLVTAQLNEVYGPDGAGSELDGQLAKMQYLSLTREKW
ncbi:MAG: hypothetical protein OEM32_08740 [Acidimicrobiia bacterium]|nr:hypothetical protein [Acidimicrobiia bacterium]